MSAETPSERLKRLVGKMPIDNVADYLQALLGMSRTAYAIQERRPGQIDAYAERLAIPSEADEIALRGLCEVTMALIDRHSSSAAARQILISSSPMLNDERPIEVFHNGEVERVVNQAWQL